MRICIGIVLIALLLTGCATGNKDAFLNTTPLPTESSTTPPTAQAEASPSPSPEGTAQPEQAVPDIGKLKANFGFADDAGKHILVTRDNQDELAEMKLINTAVGDKGKVLAVKFEKWQDGNDNNNGRETAQNFANLPGYLFTLVDGVASGDQSYYLTDRAEFILESLVPVELPSADPESAVEESVRSSIGAAKKREIQQIWKLADLSEDRQLYIVQFVREDNDMLFSIVLNTGTSLSFMDYPAVIQEDQSSVWRVDDGGEVIPDMFSVLFAADTKEGLLVGLNWWGAEGVNTFFLNQEGDSFKELDIRYGRYTSPI
ncbi:hypothetical protein [Paenibacillus sp. sgz500958]|uniref:hypothetical protein n=1 Tax=Paenibacillus sp. sgz500958 TaxID=3242475 RepID=UPI0036D34189